MGEHNHNMFLFSWAFVFVVFIENAPINCSLTNTRKSPTSYLSSNDADTVTNMLRMMDLLQKQIEKQNETMENQVNIIQHLMKIINKTPLSESLSKELPLIVALAILLSNKFGAVQTLSLSMTKQERMINHFDTKFKQEIEIINQKCSNALQKAASQVESKNKSISGIKQSIRKLSAKEQNKEKQLAILSSDLNMTKIELTSLQIDLNMTKSEVTSLQIDLNMTKSELTSLQSDLKMTKSKLSSLQSTVSQDQLLTSDTLASLSNKCSSNAENVTEMLSQLNSNMTVLDSRVRDLKDVNSAIKQSLNSLTGKEHNNEKQLVTLSYDINTTQSDLISLQSTVFQDQLRTSRQMDSLLNKYSSNSRNLTEILSQLNINMTILDSRVQDLEVVNSTIKQSLNTIATKEINTEKQLAMLSSDLNTTQVELISLQNTVSKDHLRTSDKLASLFNNYSLNLGNVSEMFLQLRSVVAILDSRVYILQEEVNSTINRSLNTFATIENNKEKQLETLSNDLNTTQSKLSFLQTTVSQDQLRTSNQLASLTKSDTTILRSVSETLSQLKSKTSSLDSRLHTLEKKIISSVRLVGGNHSGEGRVEVKYNGQWGTVCDDSFTDTNAEVVCRQLGYAWNGAIQKQSAAFGGGSGTIVLDNVSCRGPEKSIASCQHNGFTEENCGHHEDVGVVCFSIRLIGGSSSREGTVVVKLGNTEGSVCDDDWDSKDARVVCRMLGYNGTAVAVSSARFGQRTGQVWMDNVHCGGSETSLAHCSFNGYGKHNCGHGEDAGVICR